MVYALVAEGARRARAAARRRAPRALEGVDLVHVAPGAARGRDRVGDGGELRFAPGGDLRDPRGGRWSVDGDARACSTPRVARRRAAQRRLPRRAGPRVGGADLPDVRATSCSRAAPGYEFADWGGVDHVGGGSHGSLHRSDSLGALAFCGVGAARRATALRRWSIVDVAPMIRRALRPWPG